MKILFRHHGSARRLQSYGFIYYLVAASFLILFGWPEAVAGYQSSASSQSGESPRKEKEAAERPDSIPQLSLLPVNPAPSFRFKPPTRTNPSVFQDGPNFDSRRSFNGAEVSPLVSNQPIRWGPTLGQSGMLFLMFQTFRIGTQSFTRNALKGPYFKDYFESLNGLGGWGDDDPFLTNYVAHPMMGSTTTFILVQNDPKAVGRIEDFKSGPYWTSRMKGFGYSAAFSAFYELSPVGDAAIGNVGMRRDYKGVVDLVITPTLGLGWHVSEDVIDRYLLNWLERKASQKALIAVLRSFLNPTRSMANLLRFKYPWHRDSRMLGSSPPAYQHQGDPAPGRSKRQVTSWP